MLDVQNTEESILNIVQDVLALDMVRIIRLFLLYLENIFSWDILFPILWIIIQMTNVQPGVHLVQLYQYISLLAQMCHNFYNWIPPCQIASMVAQNFPIS